MEALARFWQYMVVPYPWFIALAVVGIVRIFHIRTETPRDATHYSPIRTNRRIVRDQWVAWGSLALILWLILYYGSWTIADSLVRETNVLTISYARYWLPITIVLAFWAAVGLRWILDQAATRWRPHIAALVLLGIAFTSLRTIVADPTEGLLRQRAALAEHRTRARAVIAATEPNAVIVSHRMDKVFFPERAVVHAPEDPSSDPEFLQNLRTLVAVAPVYWYAAGVVPVTGFVFHAGGVMPFNESLYRAAAGL